VAQRSALVNSPAVVKLKVVVVVVAVLVVELESLAISPDCGLCIGTANCAHPPSTHFA